MVKGIVTAVIGIISVIAATTSPVIAQQATYTLKATPKTVAWGYYEAKAAQQEMQPIIYVKHLEPPLRYPPLARQTRLSGVIVMKLKIGADGAVLAIESSAGDSRTVGFVILRDDAEKIVKTWTFGCVGCKADAPFEHTLRFRYSMDQDVVQENRVIMNLPDELIIYTTGVMIDHGPDAKNSKKGNN